MQDKYSKAPSPQVLLSKVSVFYPMEARHNFHMASTLGRLFGVQESGTNKKKRPPPALKSINLTIQAGERVGIIGRNGAGKSTLLRTIAGILPPAAGTIDVTGVVQGVFDIGVGLEMESTGRENVVFRGLLQGLSPDEIAAREEEIITFSGLGSYIDLPVSSYSSGMVVRLAFSIATFLEGNVLLVDEVFAAGDMAFQKVAQARMSKMIDSAGLFVFTSHNLSLVSEICSRGIWLEKGEIKFDGPVDDAITAYLERAV